jgi:hypothetical protein
VLAPPRAILVVDTIKIDGRSAGLLIDDPLHAVHASAGSVVVSYTGIQLQRRRQR